MREWSALRRPLFFGAALLYGALQLNRCWMRWPLPPLLTAHLADLLAMPVLLNLALALQRYLENRPRTFVLRDTWLLAAWLSVAVWFEAVLPQFSAKAVGDPLDIAAYALGTLAFRCWLNRPGWESIKKRGAVGSIAFRQVSPDLIERLTRLPHTY